MNVATRANIPGNVGDCSISPPSACGAAHNANADRGRVGFTFRPCASAVSGRNREE